MAKGLMLDVYRRAAGGADCTNGGITAHAAHVVVTGIRLNRNPVRSLDLGSQAYSPSEIAPEVILVVRTHARGIWLHLEPAEGRAEGSVGLMAGGNYAGCNDSRWAELTGGIDLVSVHDRNETPAQYAALSI
jgi:hypothetical protein